MSHPRRCIWAVSIGTGNVTPYKSPNYSPDRKLGASPFLRTLPHVVVQVVSRYVPMRTCHMFSFQDHLLKIPKLHSPPNQSQLE
jgi:hypothetical protein